MTRKEGGREKKSFRFGNNEQTHISHEEKTGKRGGGVIIRGGHSKFKLDEKEEKKARRTPTLVGLNSNRCRHQSKERKGGNGSEARTKRRN